MQHNLFQRTTCTIRHAQFNSLVVRQHHRAISEKFQNWVKSWFHLSGLDVIFAKGLVKKLTATDTFPHFLTRLAHQSVRKYHYGSIHQIVRISVFVAIFKKNFRIDDVTGTILV
jgi:hypothetical protein